ncbi:MULTISPECIES: GIY-YIG nuclease family protein [unclassified Deinococcus]|uniref:GIY-YIG nuclease family protein n=1 Tax=unclassified Deinococcus TaxID=2623546 RepID=UPI000992F091|nr:MULTISPECIES: GIY-YIG nuclease family protein [unclassified Deinococcus]MBX8465726.1 GIY-YIG nuclease family protein [Deinococcus sp. RIT780]OOV12156.1 hypothetical protein BXU09_17770 [Deinococcus sp. LM3]
MTGRPGGYVYVMRTPATIEGLCKIGFTRGAVGDTSTLERRRAEVSAATGAPGPYTVEKFQYFEDCRAAEQFIHEFLWEFHFYAEFFWIPDESYIDAAFGEASRQRSFYFGSASRSRRFTSVRGGQRWADDIQVNRPVRAHFDYVHGLRRMGQDPRHGERLLLRAAGQLLPAALTRGEVKIIRALRWLGLFHASEQLYEPYREPRTWPGLSEVARAYRRSSEAVRYFTVAAQQGDFISWGLLGQHHLARGDTAGAAEAFTKFVFEVADVFRTKGVYFESDIFSPRDSREIGEVITDGELTMQILAAASDHVLTGALPPFPFEARVILAPLLARSSYTRWSMPSSIPYRQAFAGLRHGPDLPVQPEPPRPRFIIRSAVRKP